MPGIEQTQGSFRVRQRDPGDFDPESLRTITFGGPDSGVRAVVGRIKVAKAERRPVAKSDARRVIYYVLYEPGVVDAHGEEMTAEAVAEMTWRSYGCRTVKVEHGYDQGLRGVLGGREELAPEEGIVVEHYLLDREIPPGEAFHGAPVPDGIRAGACVEAIRYSPEIYAVLSRIEHGTSLGGKARVVEE